MPAIPLNGVELFYEERGSGPLILLVHGMGGDADVWGEAADLLAEDHRVIAYDRRGFTRSKHEPVSDPQVHRDDAAALLRELDAAPATVVGWSSGGLVALDLAIREPAIVSSLVLDEPPLHATKRPGLRQMRAVIATQLLRRVRDDRAASERFFRWALRYSSGGTGFDRLSDSRREALLANGPGSMADLDAGTGEHMSNEQIAAIDCPVTCVTGELSDRAFGRATDHIVRLLPRAEVKRIPGAGHGLHLERPADFAAVVREAASESP